MGEFFLSLKLFFLYFRYFYYYSSASQNIGKIPFFLKLLRFLFKLFVKLFAKILRFRRTVNFSRQFQFFIKLLTTISISDQNFKFLTRNYFDFGRKLCFYPNFNFGVIFYLFFNFKFSKNHIFSLNCYFFLENVNFSWNFQFFVKISIVVKMSIVSKKNIFFVKIAIFR